MASIYNEFGQLLIKIMIDVPQVVVVVVVGIIVVADVVEVIILSLLSILIVSIVVMHNVIRFCHFSFFFNFK